MKIFAISASPRSESTKYILNKAIEFFDDEYQFNIFDCSKNNITPCMHCDYCLENKKCVNNNLNEFYENIKQADGIIIATPVHCGGISSNLTMLMERTRALEAIDYNILRGKIGMGIVIGGDRVGGHDLAHLRIISYYMIHGIIPVSGGPFGSNLGASFFSNDSMDDIKKDDYGFESLSRTLIEFKNFLVKYR